MPRTTRTNSTQPDSDRPLMTIPEVARRLKASRGYVYALLKRGDLRAHELPSSGGRRAGVIRIDPRDLESAMATWRTEGRS